jgi:hypothetical protein
MDKMEILQGIIEENIEYFWNNDPIIDYETNMTKLWNAFKIWCMQNCLEIFNTLEESTIEKMIDKSYSNWTNKKPF